MSASGQKVLIFGERGQLGTELLLSAPDLCLESGHTDITQREEVLAAAARAKPDAVINCAAYTAVDAAEDEPEKAYAVNAEGAGNVAWAAQEVGARCLHVSTDFVFDGAGSVPYQPTDTLCPLGVYGSSKAAGEEAVATVNPDALIVRTSWVYSAYRTNFVKTMLRLMQRGSPIRVVNDQAGTPTWGMGLAQALLAAATREEPLQGPRHWSDSGETTWYSFAEEIQRCALARGLLAEAVPIEPVTTMEYGNLTPRPAYSVLADSGFEAELDLPRRPWQSQLDDMLTTVQSIDALTN